MLENEKNLTPGERELLNSLNLRAMKILKIEEITKSHKMPIDINYIHSLSDEKLDDALELFMNMKSSSTRETKSGN